MEDFISVKGINAIGNQLTTEKIRTVNRLEPLPYEPPIVNEVEVNEEEVIDNAIDEEIDKEDNSDSSAEEDGQTKLF